MASSTIGSGSAKRALCACVCRKSDGSRERCPAIAKFSCVECGLVAYCSIKCQNHHYGEHLRVCMSSTSRAEWVPQYITDQRDPLLPLRSWKAPDVPSGLSWLAPEKVVHLWKTVPAIDVLHLEQNEGQNYDKRLKVLIAGSSDLSDVLRTVARLPLQFRGRVDFALNDARPRVVIRNVVILLLLALSDDKQLAIDAVIHLWYSARIRRQHADLIGEKVLRWLRQWESEMQRTQEPVTYTKRVFVGSGHVEVTLTQHEFTQMLNILLLETSKLHSKYSRDFCSEAPDSLDHRLSVYSSRLHRRDARMHFRERGILLPFGESDFGFDIPDRTLFHSGGQWILPNPADPLYTWPDDETDVEFFTKLFPGRDLLRNDLYGKLHSFLHWQLSKLYSVIRDGCTFSIFSESVIDFVKSPHAQGKFDRIHISGLLDDMAPYQEFGSLGTQPASQRLSRFEIALRSMKPLLNPSNPQAAIVGRIGRVLAGLFHVHPKRRRKAMQDSALRLATEVLGLSDLVTNTDLDVRSLDNIRREAAMQYFWPGHTFFRQFLQDNHVEQITRRNGLVLRETNTIVEAWPSSRKKRDNEDGAMEELEKLMDSGGNALLRYMEFQLAESPAQQT